ncbi:hypothetical protein V2J09_010831 [Rumex salicifolius]
MIRSDNALEVGNNRDSATFLASLGIVDQISSIDTPLQNGKFWGDSVLTTTYLINGVLSQLLKVVILMKFCTTRNKICTHQSFWISMLCFYSQRWERQVSCQSLSLCFLVPVPLGKIITRCKTWRLTKSKFR